MNYPECVKKSTNNVFKKHIKKANLGFTFIELILVIAILGTLMGAAALKIASNQRQAKFGQAKTEMINIQSGIEMYKSDTGQYPNTLNDLVKQPDNVKNWTGEYLPKKKLPVDPWGNKYKYEVTPDSDQPYILFAYGPNGRKAAPSEHVSAQDGK